ncbi:T9SS type A sorting domain-containing protein [Bacteroidia bacterium]|nr:T9SS type A sorting domain-containing protein [Bacteroidia bacterium]MDB9882692.1 T9SS type A sorting domain-containing protein [Bacteroidia bacterium]MDC1395786.1 T9SS type A sorting domain-containing protein [Bacteroidia bacterium]
MKQIIRGILTLVILVGLVPSKAQNHPTCDGSRYQQSVFEKVKVTRNVKFGEATTIAGVTKELFLDVYEPEGDEVTNRPVVVLAFGGSFVSGSRTDLALACQTFAQKGYVTVTIDYRLYDLPLFPFPTTEEMVDVAVKAIIDMKSALAYLEADGKNANTYGIDPEWFFVGGISAGSITASHIAYLDSEDALDSLLQVTIDNNAPIAGVTNKDKVPTIRGVLNYSGALQDASMIDAGEPPLLSYHDDGDDVVPYKGQDISFLGVPLIFVEGTFVMDSVAKVVGVRSELNTIENSTGHVSYFSQPAQVLVVLEESTLFMHSIVCTNEKVSINELELRKLAVGPNPFTRFLNIHSPISTSSELVIYDAMGRVVKNVQAVDIHKGALDLGELSSGMYQLEVNSVNTKYTTRVIKK